MTSLPCATRCSTICGGNAPATRACTSKMASPGTTGSAARSSFAQSFGGSIISITWHTTVAPGTANSCSPPMSSGFTNWFSSPRRGPSSITRGVLRYVMGTDKSGKVSKQEFMSFMEAEFERMDINKDGELDVKELTDSRVQVRTRG